MLMTCGLALGLFGAWSLLRLGLLNLLWAIAWLAGGVLAHDVFVAGVCLAIVGWGARVLPTWARPPVTVGFVVLATVTVMAIPVLGRFGALPDNPSLLDRSYGAGWLAFAGIVALGVAVGSAVARRRAAERVEGEHG
jgi:hypothetical protein